ncbi:MAG: sigma-70 family RNA polymerase sigma factor [Gemmatimonadota bacterium]
MSTKVTQLVGAWRTGDTGALEHLLPIVYDELRVLARKALRSERADHTLGPTALVHEAYARLAGSDLDVKDQSHFFAVVARTMRRVLVDHHRTHARAKRSGSHERITLDENLVAVDDASSFLALDDALQRLAALDPRKAQVVELHFFGGLTYAQTAEALGISDATVDRDLRMAKAWLIRELGPEGA